MTDQEKPTSFWIFDEHRRIYAKDPKTGRATGSPIWVEHWVERRVEGETSRSWVVVGGWNERKIPKRGPWPMPGVCRSRAEVEALAWVHEARFEIYRRAVAIHSASNVDVLRLAAALGIDMPTRHREVVLQWKRDQEAR